MFSKPFKSSGVLVVDNTLKSTFLVLILLITNLALIINKIKSLNFNINTNLIIFGGIFLFILIDTIINMINWNITYISYQNKKIRVYKNIVIKNVEEFLIDDISAIITDETFIDKIFKVSRLKIYTFSSSKSKVDMEIVLKKNKCIEFRNKILDDLNKKLDYSLEDNNCDIKINFKNVFLHSLFNIPFTKIFVIINSILLIFYAINESSNIKEVFSNLLGIFITVLGILLPVLYNFFKSLVTFYGLKLDRNGDFLHIKFGFLSTKRYIIPISKIKGIVLKETFISRIFNYVSVNIIDPSLTDNNNELKAILPMIKRKDVNKFVSRILYDEKFNVNSNYIYQPKKAIKSLSIFTILVYIIVLPILIIYNVPIIYIILFVIISSCLMFFLYYFKRIQVYDTSFTISTGVFVKKKVVLKYKDIKFFKIRKDPFLDRYGINIVDVYISSGYKNRRHSLGYISYKDANNILKSIFV